MLHVVFALDRILDGLKSLKVDKSFQSIPLSEAFYKARTMLECATDEIICHADIEYAIWTIRQDVNISTGHVEILQDLDGRDKPGHDECRQTYPAPTAFLRYARCTTQLQPGGCDCNSGEAMSLAGFAAEGACVGIASLTRRSCAD
jgi:hypothetical protein